MEISHSSKIESALRSLEGLSVGDAFGEQFFLPPLIAEGLLQRRMMPRGTWKYTDDTVMAISIVDVLTERGRIDQELLATLFAARYIADPRRGYGGKAHEILTEIANGTPWREVSAAVFNGQGSMGNGAAMRVAPIGAYFCDDFGQTVENAILSSEVTHFHTEGKAGAVAVAIAAACSARSMQDPDEFFETILTHTPDSETRIGIQKAAALPLERPVREAGSVLGNGSKVIAQDTVPFAIWCVARHMGQFENAIWNVAWGFGDIDTNCAIVGGILASDPQVSIPGKWLEAREPLENMARTKLGR